MSDKSEEACVCDQLWSVFPLKLDSEDTGYPLRDVRILGVDLTDSRYGDVKLCECKHCGTYWIRYHIEYESYTQSGRWFLGLISKEKAESLKPEEAVPYLESLDWYYQGGSYFFGEVRKVSGKVPWELFP